MKEICKNCGGKKNLSEFFKHPKRRNGVNSTKCKSCLRIAGGHQKRENRIKGGKIFCTKCKIHKKSKDFCYDKKGIKKRAFYCRECYRDSSIKFKYGLSSEGYDKLLCKQNYCCAICKTKATGIISKYFSIDHNHKTGTIRGLLCNHCNTAIGKFKDDVNILQVAIEYLNKNK